jgi:hypothetical protein
MTKKIAKLSESGTLFRKLVWRSGVEIGHFDRSRIRSELGSQEATRFGYGVLKPAF